LVSISYRAFVLELTAVLLVGFCIFIPCASIPLRGEAFTSHILFVLYISLNEAAMSSLLYDILRCFHRQWRPKWNRFNSPDFVRLRFDLQASNEHEGAIAIRYRVIACA